MTSLEASARAELARLIDIGEDRWVICLSGGLDSRVLYHLAALHAADLGATITSVHVHHGLRQSADLDADFCERLARIGGAGQFGAVETLRLDVPKGNSTQRSARIARWSAIARAMARSGARVALTAHHEDDRFETMLINATRGTGLAGLTALSEPIAPFPLSGIGESGYKVARPLLGASREEIEDFAREHRLEWIEDPSNATDLYLRNRIRHHVLPTLLEEPGAREGLRHTLDNLVTSAGEESASASALLARARQHTDHAVMAANEIALDRARFTSALPTHRARSLLMIAEELNARWDRSVLARIEEALGAIEAGHKKRHKESLPLTIDAKTLRFTPTLGDRGDRGIVREAEAIPIDLTKNSGEVPWFDGTLRWEVERAPLPSAASNASARGVDEDLARFVLEDLARQGPLTLRGPRPGEKILVAPGKEAKVKEVLRARGIAANDRWRQGCLATDAGIIWLVGVAKASRFELASEGSGDHVCFRWEPKPDGK